MATGYRKYRQKTIISGTRSNQRAATPLPELVSPEREVGTAEGGPETAERKERRTVGKPGVDDDSLLHPKMSKEKNGEISNV